MITVYLLDQMMVNCTTTTTVRVNTATTNTVATPVTAHTSWQIAGTVVSFAGAAFSLEGTVVSSDETVSSDGTNV